MKNNVAICMLWMFTIAWWGMVFPKYCYTKDCVEIVEDNTVVQEGFESKADFFAFLECGTEQIEFKSKLYEQWKSNKQR